MRNLRLVGVPQRGVAVVGASAREGIVALGQKLQHKIIGTHANAQKHGVVAVVRVNEVGGLELQRYRKLNRLVAARCSVHIGSRNLLIGLIKLRHGLGGCHQFKRMQRGPLLHRYLLRMA